MGSDSSKIEYKPNEIEAKWQKKWEDDKTFSPSLQAAPKPYYNLMMFPYPSAEGLHVGNMYAFTGADVHGRLKRMQGNDVFEPIGLDGFGIHSENYALKVGRHPKEQAQISQKNFYRQLRATGNAYDWTRTLETYDPQYFRWTQWVFIQMFKQGLAYRKKAQVNWCPSDKTVLADEQVIDGKCERDGAVVEKRDLEQWFFRITEYADKLLANIDTIDWPEKIKTAQRQWIGRSEGARIEFKIQNSKFKIDVFTTAYDTIFGVTFMVISPEHPLLNEIDISEDNKKVVLDYIKTHKSNTSTTEEKDKTGVFTGQYVINPVNNKEIPLWVADYVLMDYGTGIVMGVPGHDARDHEFAKKYKLPIVQVIEPTEETKNRARVEVDGFWNFDEIKIEFSKQSRLINSGKYDGLSSEEARKRMLEDFPKEEIGKKEKQYHLRDWLISRQRYWGPPIPMVYCEKCAKQGKSWFTTDEAKQRGLKIKDKRLKSERDHQSEIINRQSMSGWYPVPEDQLPVLLPDVEDWRPRSSSDADSSVQAEGPLASHPEFYETACPGCGGGGKRETDVSDTFLDSAWYYLRYVSLKTQNSKVKSQKEGEFDPKKAPYDIDILKKWCPVAIYIGGAEHSVLHLLYVRFVALVLHDLPHYAQSASRGKKNHSETQDLALPFEEPFPQFVAHGLIVKDGAKMSKSRGNVVIPDAYIAKYGADTLRMYLMFIGQFKDGGDFRDTGIEGMNRFVKRVWTLLTKETSEKTTDAGMKMMHKTIKGVTEDIEKFSYNTAIAKMMEWYNFLSEQASVSQEEVGVYLKLLAPFAPHFTEELYQMIFADKVSADIHGSNQRRSIHFSAWPTYDEKYLVQDKVIIPIQINGKRRGEVTVESSIVENKEEVEARAREAVKTHLEGKEIRKVIYVPGKIINFVV